MGFLFFWVTGTTVYLALRVTKSMVQDFVKHHSKELIHAVMFWAQWGLGSVGTTLTLLLVHNLDWWATPIMYVFNVAKIWLLIRIHDWAMEVDKETVTAADHVRGRKRVAIMFSRHNLVGYSRSFIGIYYGVLKLRKGNHGIPKRYFPEIGLTILGSTIFSILIAKGIFSVWDTIQNKVLQFYWDFVFPYPFII